MEQNINLGLAQKTFRATPSRTLENALLQQNIVCSQELEIQLRRLCEEGGIITPDISCVGYMKYIQALPERYKHLKRECRCCAK